MIDSAETNAAKIPTKRKRSNKNKKKNWRKKIDISAVEEALETQNLEIRTGGIISEKKDEEIFFLDKSAVASHVPKREHAKTRRLKVDENLVPDPSLVKPAKKPGRVSRNINKTLEKKIIRLQKKTRGGKSKETELYDLWSKDSLELYDIATKKRDVSKYSESVSGKRQVKRPKYLEKKPNDIKGYKYRNVPAVEVAHPGASYNPSFTDHQDLLAEAHQIEVKKARENEKIRRALHVPYDQLPDKGAYEKEMEEGLYAQGDNFEEGSKESDDVVIANAPVRAADRKTRRTRKTEERLKKEKTKREIDWANKLRQNQVFRTKTFLSEIRETERKNMLRRNLRSKKLRMMRLSNVKFSPQDIELKLSSEIEGSLRQLKPEAGLLTDRYKSFQKRGIVEPRCKRNVPKRKTKIKYQEKRLWREIE